MRVLIIPISVPLPANSGGRIDVWRRMCGLRAAGAELALLCWYDDAREGYPSSETRLDIDKVATSALYVPIKRSVQELVARFLNLWRWPSHVASRWVTSDRAAILAWARTFKPDVVLLDGLYGGAVASWLADELGVPLAYRSHNIEHAYMAHLAGLQRSWKSKLGLIANLIGLERFERHIFDRAEMSLDISLDDRDWWQQNGYSRVEWLPTSVDDAFAAMLRQPSKKDIDVLYFGNLHTPNNVDAIRWLLQDIRPRLRRGLVITIAGSNPNDDVKSLIRSSPNAQLIDSPADMAAIIRRAKVLVNPVRFGSGVNLKSVEMLFTDSALVSTTTGVKGLSHKAKQCFHIADLPDDFASAIDFAIDSPPPLAGVRSEARSDFDPKQAFFSLQKLTSAPTPDAPTPQGHEGRKA